MNRKKFIKISGMAATGGLIIPTVVPSTVIGKYAPSNRINIGMIGTGRQAIQANLKNGFLKLDNCQVIAINDVDIWRMNLAKNIINETYSNQKNKKFSGVKSYNDYRELIADQEVDAVMISTADHWHVPVGIAAALAGKHVCVEKALSVCFSHSKALKEAVKFKKVANRLDSEFRSIKFFSKAVEMVHNGLIGSLISVQVGVPGELSGSAVGPQPEMQIPEDLNYDMWLGPSFPQPYTQNRVHDPETIETRPGWMRIDDYCNGMITNWGAHLCDIALWGMQKENELPVKISGTGTFSKGLWNTIESFTIEYEYADGFIMKYMIDQPYVKFEGEKGWIKVSYPGQLEASDSAILSYIPSPQQKNYSGILSDKADFLRSVDTGKESIESLEIGHNVYATNFLGLIAVQIGNTLKWDADAEKFIDDNAANSLLIRPFREKWLDRPVIDWINKYQHVDLK